MVKWKLAAMESFEKMILCRGSTNSPIAFAWINSISPIIWNHEVCSCLLKKSIKIRMHAEMRSGGKLIWKMGFYWPKRISREEQKVKKLKVIWKQEFRELDFWKKGK